jgi:hypothetical protein
MNGQKIVYVKYEGGIWPVTNMFDIDKEETEDISLAVTCVAKMATTSVDASNTRIECVEWLVLAVCDGDLITNPQAVARRTDCSA